MIHLKDKVKSFLGPLWWYTAILFVVQRFGDVMNAVIGLWLVPRYVPQEELGAVLPLSQVGTTLALPLSVLTITFIKYVNVFAVREELGKVKSLLRDVFVLSGVLSVLIFFGTRFLMPYVFERMRVGDGSIGTLIVMSASLMSISAFFSGALQALKKFRFVSLTGLLAPPLRFMTLMICFPFRALSGYFVGQIVPALYGIGVALFGLRSVLFDKKIKAMPYIQTDGRDMVHFMCSVLLGSLFFAPKDVIEVFVIRHRLPEIDSAAYYVMSRFAEIGTYVGATMTYILFPMASEQHEQGNRSQKLLFHGIGGSLGAGLILAGLFLFAGRHLVCIVPNGESYVSYVPHLALLTVITSLRCAFQCFLTHEIACCRFAPFWWIGPFFLLSAVVLYCATGFSFFAPYVPASWVIRMDAINPGRLSFILGFMFATAIIPIFFMVCYLFSRRWSQLRNRLP